MTDCTELLERLRAPVPTVYDCKDAADALAAQAARIAELEAENEELKKAISKPWMGSARAAFLGEKE
jgi:hypothetical protein